MMATSNEIQRLAAAANALRPEWPVSSLITLLSTKQATRPYRDLAVALAWVATDATSKTPARLSEAGPWWSATSMSEGIGPSQLTQHCPEHPAQKAGNCRACKAAAVPKPDWFVVPNHERHTTEKPEKSGANTPASTPPSGAAATSHP